MSTVLLNIVLILVFIVDRRRLRRGRDGAGVAAGEPDPPAGHRGKRGQTVARLTENPNRFLSAVQIGVTLSGFLSAAFGAATLSDDLAPVLQRLGLSASVAVDRRARS